MIDIKKLKAEQQVKHPGFNSYLECTTRSLFSGLAAFTIGFAGVYFSQKLLQKKLPYSPKFSILISAVFASIVSYKITKDRSRTCQALWMATEDKYTALQEK